MITLAYFDTYKSRLTNNGNTGTDRIKNNFKRLLDDYTEDAPDVYTVSIDSQINIQAIIQDHTNPLMNIKKIESL